LAVCRRLASVGLASTIGYAAGPGEPAQSVADRVVEAFAGLRNEDFDCYVSIKLSRLGFDPRLFGQLKAAAAAAERRLHIDALDPGSVVPTLELMEETTGPGLLGGTLPGRWERSLADAERMTALGLPLRVVKGQWADTLPNGPTARQGFLKVVERLAGYGAGVAVATHDRELLDSSLRRLTDSRTPCEAELLLGLPFAGPAEVARRLRIPLRIYVPFGDTGAPYSIRSAARRPAVLRWLVEDLALGPGKRWRGIGGTGT
jgi:proline dehydrogenase